jgi:hypothetical protein
LARLLDANRSLAVHQQPTDPNRCPPTPTPSTGADTARS